MKIAVEGCCHGELDKIYETVAFIEQKDDIKVDLLLICGDFQAVRNKSDFHALAVPPKYQRLNTFYKYYSGEKKAPVFTIVIGGNHEASNYFQELPYGGWIAPNMYYLGYAGVVQFGGLRIGGMSGIYKARDYNKGHFEHPPYSEDTKRSCYHIRNVDVFRLKQLQQPVDIMMSHDWPRGIYNYGDVNQLLRRKQYFREEVESGSLGSPPAEELLFKLKPTFWFSAHLHVKFPALVEHQDDGDIKRCTKFLALDKCLPKRQFLQIIDVPHNEKKLLELELDPEWLCILKSTNHLLTLGKAVRYMPGPGCSERYDFTVDPSTLSALQKDFGGVFKIPENFCQTAQAHSVADDKGGKWPVPQIMINPQTTLICDMLGITDPFAVFSGKAANSNFDTSQLQANDSNDSLLEDNDDEGIHDDSDFVETTMETSVNASLETTLNPDEISLDDIGDEDEVEEDERGVGSSALPAVSPISLPLPHNCVDIMEDDPVTSTAQPVTSPITDHTQSDLDPSETQACDSNRVSMCVEATDSDNADGNTSRDSDSSLKRSYEGVPDVDNTEQVAIPTGAKKLKRRNQSLYTPSEDS